MITKPENENVKNNKVTARGRVIGYVRNDYGHLGLTLFIRGNSSRSGRGGNDRNSENDERRGRRTNMRNESNGTYVHFAYGKDTEMPLDVTINSTVDIIGHIEANVVKNDVWDKSSYIQYMVIDEIKKADTQLEEAFPGICEGKGFAYHAPYIHVALMGEVLNISKSNDNAQDDRGSERVWTRLRLKVDPVKGSSRPSIVEMQYSSNMRVSDVECRIGDTVCITAMMVSRQKITKGSNQPRNFEDIIVNDMAIVASKHPEMETEDIVNVLAETEAEKKPEKEILAESKKASFGGLSIGQKNNN